MAETKLLPCPFCGGHGIFEGEEGAAGLAERLSDWRARGVSGEDADAAASALLSQASQIEALRKERDAALRANEALNSAIDRCRVDASAAETKLAEAISLLLKERQTRYASDVSPLENMKAIDTFLDANGGGQ